MFRYNGKIKNDFIDKIPIFCQQILPDKKVNN